MATIQKKPAPVKTAPAKRNEVIDQICASLGARYHDLKLFQAVKNKVPA
ncbi:hypothetical protein Q8A64_17675 [Oxalobacteraceae bacterium R-40]|uniref:Uncharacterized protein n=1 Tax=Keguizhuia sedimenti TaxID=3064264 RepID=A0ABU1BT75_9BURK|nr:hypothetical protein [Oxalobacteraceae bacterium R-40]MDQ9172245.1 hypothetical protein [Oxalobacteraceae bacterium R-40]